MNEQNYYQEIVAKINYLINLAKWNDALILVKEELNAPYIPREYEKQFQVMLTTIINNIKQNQVSQFNWNLAKIANILETSTNEEMHLVSFYYLQSQNVRLILSIIKNYFLDQRWSNVNKVRLLFILKEQGIDELITVVKSDGTYNVNPSKLELISENKTYLKIKGLLKSKVMEKNISQYNVAKYLLTTYFENLVPQNIDVSAANALAAAIYIHACSFFLIKVTLLASAELFATTSNLVKNYLKSLRTYQIT